MLCKIWYGILCLRLMFLFVVGGEKQTTIVQKSSLGSSLEVSQKYLSTSKDLYQGNTVLSFETENPNQQGKQEESPTQRSLTNTGLQNSGEIKTKTVFGDVSLVKISEPEECVDDDSSADEKEAHFLNGVKAISKLSKDITGHDKKNASIKRNKKNATKEFTTDIDLGYLAKLFKAKDVTKFQEKFNEHMKNKSFEELRQKLYNNKSKLKIFEAFDGIDKTTEENLNKLIADSIKKDAESIRHKIHFPLFYHAVGTITLPYDDLVEPFEAWYAGELNMSRIDYYYGMDKSYQRGDIGRHGVIVKITPAHWGKKSDLDKTSISCWYKEETKWTNRRGQTVVPMNIKKFQFAGEDHFNGVPSYKFTFQKSFVHKNNTYIFHVTQAKPYKPLRYEMIGYDHLLRSHYDHYIIDYFAFDAWEFDYKVFQIPKKYKCYKKLKKMKSHFEANPMWDFLNGEEPKHREHELNETFENYKNQHKKNYNSHVENHKRKDIFRHNSRFVHSHNRAKLNYSLELNPLSDISDDEFEMLKGQPDVDTPEMQKEINDIPQMRLEIPAKPLPKQLDWRDFGLVGDVYGQSFCASCWAFSAIGAIETAFALQNGSLKELSVQELIDCSWGYDNNGCRGGWSWRALKFVGEHGIATKKSYGKYLGQEGYCHCGNKDKCETIEKISYRTIEKHDPQKLKIAVAKFGAGSISVQCNRKTFKFYSAGVYDDPKCGQRTDHAVVIVGYGEENGIPYWLIKNSWGKLWGDKGYIKISINNDLCGVLQNGALMVSLNGWKETESTSFPFEKFKKVENKESKSLIQKFNFRKDENLDLFSPPDHVIEYLQNKSR